MDLISNQPAQASEGTLGELSCVRLVHGRHALDPAGGLDRFTALRALTLLHSYLVPEDGSSSPLVYKVPASDTLPCRQPGASLAPGQAMGLAQARRKAAAGVGQAFCDHVAS